VFRELAEKQHGVVAWRQLREMGLGEGLILSRIRDEQLIPLHRGVFAVGHRRIGAARRMDGGCARRRAECGALPWKRRSALGDTGIEGANRGNAGFGSSPPARGPPPSDEVAPGRATRVEIGIPVTSIERTFLDNAARLDARQMEHDLIAADRSGRLRWEVLWS